MVWLSNMCGKYKKYKLYNGDSGASLQLHTVKRYDKFSWNVKFGQNGKFSQNGKLSQNGKFGQNGKVH